MNKEFILLEDLEVYQLSRELSRLSWAIYESLNWQDRKIMGDQFIESMDSVGANIAEGYRRYHYLDRIKFYYNSRSSLCESCNHWLGLLIERNKITQKQCEEIRLVSDKLSIKLNNFISANFQALKRKNKKQ